MDRDSAETYLRIVADAELRRLLTLPGDKLLAPGYAARVVPVADVLAAIGAVSPGTAEMIVSDFLLARAVRLPAWPGEPAESPMRPVRVRQRLMMIMNPDAARQPVRSRSAAPRPGPYRVAPAGQVIPAHAEDGLGELHLLVFAQTAGGAWITMTARTHRDYPPAATAAPFSQFAATDDKGASYTLRFRGGGAEEWSGELWLDPVPRHDIRWLDLTPAPGLPVTRMDVDPRALPPQVTVTATADSPGERLLNGIALRMLAWAAEFPPDLRSQLGGLNRAQLGDVIEGACDVIAALRAARALPPTSPVPGQLAALYAGLGLTGHGIAAQGRELPEPWRSVLMQCRRGKPDPAPARWACAAAAAALPELDGVRLAILGLRTGKHGTVMNVHATGVAEQPCSFGELSPLPPLWLRDSLGQWHATRDSSSGIDMSMLQLAVVPPLSRTVSWIELLAVGRSAQVGAKMPLRWKDY